MALFSKKHLDEKDIFQCSGREERGAFLRKGCFWSCGSRVASCKRGDALFDKTVLVGGREERGASCKRGAAVFDKTSLVSWSRGVAHFLQNVFLTRVVERSGVLFSSTS